MFFDHEDQGPVRFVSFSNRVRDMPFDPLGEGDQLADDHVTHRDNDIDLRQVGYMLRILGTDIDPVHLLQKTNCSRFNSVTRVTSCRIAGDKLTREMPAEGFSYLRAAGVFYAEKSDKFHQITFNTTSVITAVIKIVATKTITSCFLNIAAGMDISEILSLAQKLI